MNKNITTNQTNERNANWKGNNVGYFGLHSWIASKLGKPKRCDFCLSKTSKRFEWANKTGKYKRDLNDWIRLCKSCHNKFDWKESNYLRENGRFISKP